MISVFDHTAPNQHVFSIDVRVIVILTMTVWAIWSVSIVHKMAILTTDFMQCLVAPAVELPTETTATTLQMRTRAVSTILCQNVLAMLSQKTMKV
jgi:hypothetical protein